MAAFAVASTATLSAKPYGWGLGSHMNVYSRSIKPVRGPTSLSREDKSVAEMPIFDVLQTRKRVRHDQDLPAAGLLRTSATPYQALTEWFAPHAIILMHHRAIA
jgi:hypothetical protein